MAGRAAGAHARIWVRGGIALCSIYLISGAGPGKANLELLWELSRWLASCGMPVIFGGDWQMSPGELLSLGWIQGNDLVIRTPSAPTCGSATIDFFAVSRAIQQYCEQPSVIDL